MKNAKKLFWGTTLLLIWGGCNKAETDQPHLTKTVQPSGNHIEDVYDQHVRAAGYGVLGLATNTHFITLLKKACDEQFDGDDNVLFRRLSEMAAENQINVKTEMENSLKNLGKTDLIPLVDGVINGFDYYDTRVYLQVYIPFTENYTASKSPWVSFNYNDDARLESYRMENGKLAEREIDETFAKENPVWVISGNETVDKNGEVPKHLKDSYLKDARTSKVYIVDKKESWGNGKAEISNIAIHVKFNGCVKGDVFLNDKFIRISNNQLGSWVTVPNTLSAYFAVNDGQTGSWEPGENILIVYFEQDVRKKFERVNQLFNSVGCNSCSSNPEFRVIYNSKETPYGFINLRREDFANTTANGTNTRVFQGGFNPCFQSIQINGDKFEIWTRNN